MLGLAFRSFFYSFNCCFLNSYCVPGTVLGHWRHSCEWDRPPLWSIPSVCMGPPELRRSKPRFPTGLQAPPSLSAGVWFASYSRMVRVYFILRGKISWQISHVMLEHANVNRPIFSVEKRTWRYNGYTVLFVWEETQGHMVGMEADISVLSLPKGFPTWRPGWASLSPRVTNEVGRPMFWFSSWLPIT